MSARDDYPWVHSSEDIAVRVVQWENMCEEIDLRRTQGEYITRRFGQARRVVSQLRVVADEYERLLDEPAIAAPT